jgi:hypothetical protein
MTYREQLENKLQHVPVSFIIWGHVGKEAAQRIAQELNICVKCELLDFISEVGNLRIDPFAINITGDNEGRIGTVQATLSRRKIAPNMPLSLIQIMDHAGEVYLLDTDSGAICAYDEYRICKGEETLQWESLTQFIIWTIGEARAFQHDTQFS